VKVICRAGRGVPTVMGSGRMKSYLVDNTGAFTNEGLDPVRASDLQAI
jgi:hypothetical protein